MAQTSYPEQRKTAANQKQDVMEAKVIANYGDPGLDEDYHFDILSRYVIVMIESCQRIPTKDKCHGMIVLVKRPSVLYIDAVNIPDGNPTNQQRKDAKENVSVGLAGAFSTNGISRIYPAYAMGETISIRKTASLQPNDTFFYSKFNKWDSNTWSYGAWHSDGSTLPYFSTDAMKSNLRQKTIEPTEEGSNYYRGFLHKMQYEAFALDIMRSSTTITNGLTSIFGETWGGNPAVYSANGGYVFANGITNFLLNTVAYEDINVGNKARVATNECIPLVVATPNTFPMPSSRSVGTIIYNPTYSPISR